MINRKNDDFAVLQAAREIDFVSEPFQILDNMTMNPKQKGTWTPLLTYTTSL